MKLKKFMGKTSREVLRDIREALGSDAMIVSSRQTPEGVEMIAMSSDDAESVLEPSSEGGRAPSKKAGTPPNATRTLPIAELTGNQPSEREVEEATGEVSLKDYALKLSAAGRELARRDDPGLAPIAAVPVDAKKPEPSKPQRTTVRLAEPVQKSIDRSERRAPAPVAAEPADAVARRTGPSAPHPIPASREAFAPQVVDHLFGALAAPVGSLPTFDAPPAPLVFPALHSPAGGSSLQEVPRLFETVQSATPTVSDAVAGELRAMRDLLSRQWADIAWRDTMLRYPKRAAAWRELSGAGFSPALARMLAERVPDHLSEEKTREWLRETIARNLSCRKQSDELVERGGVFALVGPTGVGKTTTAAKLAARCVVRYGTDSLGLISSDAYRIGAQDQLRMYGRILGVQVYTAQTPADLAGVLASMRRKRLVLVDAMGVGQRDSRVSEQAQWFASVGVQRLLVASAACQPEALEEVVLAYEGSGHGKGGSQKSGLAGCVLTKLDEAVKIGHALDAVIRHRLTLQYVATGQRVPEDLHLANPGVLAHKALRNKPAAPFLLSDLEFDLSHTPGMTVHSGINAQN